VRVWPSPRPEDDGVSDLVDVLEGMFPAQLGSTFKLGAELGWEFSLRMPLLDFQRLEKSLEGRVEVSDATLLVKRVRAVKSELEVAHQRLMCHRQGEALDRIPSVVHGGMTEDDACRIARIELLKSGADRVPYMSCRSGAGGYDDIVGAATQRVLREGDMLIIDTGSMREGYYCDFNRNWYIGDAADIPKELAAVQKALYAAVDAGIKAARTGHNTADIFHAMSAKLPGPESTVGRAGHGSGLAITEWPSILPAVANQNVTLEEGMIFSIEPSLSFGDRGQFLVHEEVIVVRGNGGELLSERGPRTIPVISANGARAKATNRAFPSMLLEVDHFIIDTLDEKFMIDTRSMADGFCDFNAVWNRNVTSEENRISLANGSQAKVDTICWTGYQSYFNSDHI